MPLPWALVTCFAGSFSPRFHAWMAPSSEKASKRSVPGANSIFCTLEGHATDHEDIIDADEDHVKIRPPSPETARIFPSCDMAMQNMRCPGDCFRFGSTSLPAVLNGSWLVPELLVFCGCTARRVLKTHRLKISFVVFRHVGKKDPLHDKHVPAIGCTNPAASPFQGFSIGISIHDIALITRPCPSSLLLSPASTAGFLRISRWMTGISTACSVPIDTFPIVSPWKASIVCKASFTPSAIALPHALMMIRSFFSIFSLIWSMHFTFFPMLMTTYSSPSSSPRFSTRTKMDFPSLVSVVHLSIIPDRSYIFIFHAISCTN